MLELVRYDVLNRVFGFRRVYHDVVHAHPRVKGGGAPSELILNAMSCAESFYWKPARCLQRSVASVRLLRRHGVDAKVVIGFRAAPFASHAWVEIGGRIANDSPTYQRQFAVLDRF
jgi:hypothetical protein